VSHTVRTGESYFPSVERANEAVAYALDFNHERIRRWVATGASRPLRIYAVPGGVTGRGNPFMDPQDLEAVRVVLVGSSDNPSGYTVFTAYPAVASITARNFRGFDDFVGTYFHQDWADEPYSADQALDDYLAHTSRDACLALLADIRDLDEILPDEAALGGRLIELDCNYLPADDDLDDRQWLRHVAARVQQHLDDDRDGELHA
jgi:hypothetical protein